MPESEGVMAIDQYPRITARARSANAHKASTPSNVLGTPRRSKICHRGKSAGKGSFHHTMIADGLKPRLAMVLPERPSWAMVASQPSAGQVAGLGAGPRKNLWNPIFSNTYGAIAGASNW